MCDNNNDKPKNYKGISKTAFKKRYANHKRSFNIYMHKNIVKLSVEYWNLKVRSTNPKVTCPVKKQFSVSNPESRKYSLCLNEKL